MQYKQDFTKNWSWFGNGLLENQQHWPLLIRDKTLTVDPILFSSTFGPKSPSEDSIEENLANTPGVRLEYLVTDATKSSQVLPNGVCTITIANSGTYNAYAVITWPDTTTTRINLVAPSMETKHAQWDDAGPNWNILPGANPGPYPVYMTLQELCDTLDTFLFEAELDNSARTKTVPAGFQWQANKDPSAVMNSNFATKLANWGGAAPEVNWALAATVWMPMLKNMNQSMAASGMDGGGAATPNESWADFATAEHITTPIGRWDHTPGHADGVIYGFRGMSGDMKTAVRTVGYNHYNATTNNMNQVGGMNGICTTQQANHGASPNPKWRMRTALAVFLKDGTYTISNGGAIIPYTYDPDRMFGGFAMGGKGADRYYYGTWDGGAAAAAETSDTGEGTLHSAQVYGGFVQGPFCPAPQSHNVNGMKAYNYEWYASSSDGTWWPGFGVPSDATRNVTGYWPKGPGFTGRNINPIKFVQITGDTCTRDGSDPMNFKFDFAGSDAQTTRPATPGGQYGLGMKRLQTVIIDDTTDPAVPVMADLPKGFGWVKGAPVWFSTTNTEWQQNSAAYTIPASVATGKGADSLEYNWHIGNPVGTEWWLLTDPYWIVNLADDAGTLHDLSVKTIICCNGNLWWTGEQGLMTDNPDGIPYVTCYAALWPDRYLIGSGEKNFSDLLSGSGHSSAPTDYGNRIGGSLNRLSGIGPDDGRAGDYWFEPGGGREAKFTKGGGCLRVPPGRFSMALFRDTSETVAGNMHLYRPMGIQWQMCALEMWLLSDMESTTGKRAWDEMKPKSISTVTTTEGNRQPTQWPMGRNRNWPGHTRAWGTKLGSQPCLMPKAADYGVAGYGVPTTKYSSTENSCSPMFIDLEITAYFPSQEGQMTRLVFEPGTSLHGRGEVGGHLAAMSVSKNSTPFLGGASSLGGVRNGFHGHYIVGGSPFGNAALLPSGDITSMATPVTQSQLPNSRRTDNPLVWYIGPTTRLLANAQWSSLLTTVNPSRAPPSTGGGFGAIDADEPGIGTPFEMGGGTHKWRCAFDNGGMSFFLDDALQGKYLGGGTPVYSFGIQQGALNYSDTSTTNRTDKLELESEDQLCVDEMKLRQVPSRAMLPFKIETTTIPITDAVIYNTLELEVGGVNPTMDYNIRATICTPGTTTGDWAGYGQAPGTPIADFTDLDLQITGGYGSVSLKTLPASVFVSGMTIRFEFYIPHSGSTNAPVNWESCPEITNWKIKYDRKPTATCAATGNTFNNDITSPITTEVGHIITYRTTGTTTDPDRVIKHVQYTFGDGTVTDWLELPTPAMSVNHTITHSYARADTSMNMTAQFKDDNGNYTDATTPIVVNVNASSPVASIKGSPMMIRAGQSVRLDASKSYDVDSDTLTAFTFTPGDGSSNIGPQAQNYTDHTYSVAGEYRATMTCEDGAGNSSNTASCIIKVLPANLVIPLTLNTMPSEFQRSRGAKFNSTPVLDAAFPEMRDTGQRSDRFSLKGMFLQTTADTDIAFMEELLMTGALVEFEWQAVNYTGTPDSKTFVGRMTDFQYERAGGQHGQTPWSATFTREASLGV